MNNHLSLLNTYNWDLPCTNKHQYTEVLRFKFYINHITGAMILADDDFRKDFG